MALSVQKYKENREAPNQSICKSVLSKTYAKQLLIDRIIRKLFLPSANFIISFDKKKVNSLLFVTEPWYYKEKPRFQLYNESRSNFQMYLSFFFKYQTVEEFFDSQSDDSVGCFLAGVIEA